MIYSIISPLFQIQYKFDYILIYYSIIDAEYQFLYGENEENCRIVFKIVESGQFNNIAGRFGTDYT